MRLTFKSYIKNKAKYRLIFIPFLLLVIILTNHNIFLTQNKLIRYRTYDQKLIRSANGEAILVGFNGKVLKFANTGNVFSSRTGNFLAELNYRKQELTIIDLFSEEKTVIANHVTHAIWSADGDKLYYFKQTNFKDGLEMGSYYVCNLADKKSYLAASYVPKNQFIISTDGRTFAYTKINDDNTRYLEIRNLQNKLIFTKLIDEYTVPVAINKQETLVITCQKYNARNLNLEFINLNNSKHSADINESEDAIVKLNINLDSLALANLKLIANNDASEVFVIHESGTWLYMNKQISKITDYKVEADLPLDQIIYASHYENLGNVVDVFSYNLTTLLPTAIKPDNLNTDNHNIDKNGALILSSEGEILTDGSRDNLIIDKDEWLSRQDEITDSASKQISKIYFDKLMRNPASILSQNIFSQFNLKFWDYNRLNKLGYFITQTDELYLMKRDHGNSDEPLKAIFISKNIDSANKISIRLNGKTIWAINKDKELWKYSLRNNGEVIAEKIRDNIVQFDVINAENELLLIAEENPLKQNELNTSKITTGSLFLYKNGKIDLLNAEIYLPLNNFHFNWIE